MNIEKRRAEIAARKAEIRKLLTDDKNADIDALEKELRELNEEDAGLEKRQAIERMLNPARLWAIPSKTPSLPAACRRGYGKAVSFRMAENLAGQVPDGR